MNISIVVRNNMGGVTELLSVIITECMFIILTYTFDGYLIHIFRCMIKAVELKYFPF